jgi:hypothetical protein
MSWLVLPHNNAALDAADDGSGSSLSALKFAG